MNRVTPKYVLGNFVVQLVIDKADEGHYSLVGELLEIPLNPYLRQTDLERWFAKHPDCGKNRVGCLMLSGSS